MAKRLTDKQKKKIIADYANNGNYSETARKNKISKTTVSNVIKANPESYRKLQQKKENNNQEILDYMDSKRDLVKSFIDIALEDLNDPVKLKKSTPSQVATAMGIIIDKFTGNTRQSNENRLEQLRDLYAKEPGNAKPKTK